MHLGHVKEGQRVLLIDDLIATGGTLAAGIKLMKQVHLLSILHAQEQKLCIDCQKPVHWTGRRSDNRRPLRCQLDVNFPYRSPFLDLPLPAMHNVPDADM